MATFERSQEDGIPILVVTGKLGLESLDKFESELKVLGDEQGKCVILDLMHCPYMSSRTFPPLLHMKQELDSSGRHLLIACSEGLMEILQILRLDKKLDLHPTRVKCLDISRTLGSL